MALPKLQTPIYQLELPTTKQEVNYRPFLVSEEKVLLMASEAKDQKEQISAIKQIVNNCLVDNIVNVDELATIDIEYIFLNLRSKSVSNISKLVMKDKEDGETYPIEIDIDEVAIKRNEAHTNIIELDAGIGVTMKYPSLKLIEKIGGNLNKENIVSLIKACIDSVYDTKDVYDMADQTEEEKEQWVSSLSMKHIQKIQTFFDTMPKLSYTVSYTNTKGNERKVELNGLQDFFS